MKKFLIICFVVNLSLAYGQDCSNYYYMQRNKTVEMSLYDKRGDATGKMVYSIGDVTNSNSVTTATIQSEIFDKKGKTIAKSNSIMKCDGGVIMIDMKLMMPAPQAEQVTQATLKSNESYLEYPVSMSKGDKLKDGAFSMDWDNNGMPQSMAMRIFDRVIEDQEKITTPAGSWDCYKITYKSKITVKVMGVGVPMNMDGSEWYAPGFGVVKTVSKHGTTLITSIK